MGKVDEEIARDLSPFLRIYKDGRVERLRGTEVVPPSSSDPASLVLSKDVTLSTDPPVSVRLYLPNNLKPNSSSKLPLVVYFHGGAFLINSAMSPTYHSYVATLAAEAKAVIVSVEYRLAPEFPLPAAYDDSWAAVSWVCSHAGGLGQDEWLNNHADFSRVLLAGDSAGANIAHRMGLRLRLELQDEIKTGLGAGLELSGLILVHPYFWGNDPLPGETTEPGMRTLINDLWRCANPTSTGCDDLFINPAMDPGLKRMGCSRVLLCVGGKDVLRQRGWQYKEAMEKSGWEGDVETMESEGEEHVFHLRDPTSERAVAMMKRLVVFVNE